MLLRERLGKMYYKLYRRRQYIYLLAAVFGVIFLYNYRPSISSTSASSSRDDESPHHAKKLENLADDPEITILTYKEPEPCKSCPGENGQAVVLTVSLINLQSVDTIYYLISRLTGFSPKSPKESTKFTKKNSST